MMSKQHSSEVTGNAEATSRKSTRRQVLKTTALTAAALATGQSTTRAGSTVSTALNGRINQSIVYWCFEKYWDMEKACQIAKQLGCASIELVEQKHWPLLKKNGLVCALASSHGFEQGMNNPKYQEMCIERIRSSIDACAEFEFPNVITFTGFREDIPDDVGLQNCIDGYKRVIGYAEKKKVNLCLEMLNSRVKTEMQGHPGYQGDHTDYCMEIVQRVNSPRMKLLFDIYHVQIMDGDIISRIREYKDHIGHYHTAGNPGRKELDDQQEINYRPIMEEIAKTGYGGFVGQEFIPTRDPLQGLKEAVNLCDV